MPRRLGLTLLLFVVVLAVASVGASSTGKTVGASAQATAFAVHVVGPGVVGTFAAQVAAPPAQLEPKAPFAYPEDGSIVRADFASADVAARWPADARAQAGSELTGLSLFNGEITATTVSARSLAVAAPKSLKTSFGGSRVVGLQVLGQPVAAVPETTLPLADWGTLTVLNETTQNISEPGVKGYRNVTTALHVHLDLDHGGLPAGADIFVGSAEAIVHPGTALAAPDLPTAAPEIPDLSTGITPVSTRRAPGLSLNPPRQAPPNVHPPLTAGGYVFPVYGRVSWGDTFGARRAPPVTWHHGDDIFAPVGAPILAVADGTLFSVGWNDIGGLRLWLRDGAGNEFYYAHLSALSIHAVNGAQVQAGEVIGFVGNTGDARTTPPHLHFEIHPVSMLYLGYDGAVNPTKYLLAWEKLRDVPITGVASWVPPLGGAAPKAGAILLLASDISTASGLDPASLRHALSAEAAPVYHRAPRPESYVPRPIPLDRG